MIFNSHCHWLFIYFFFNAIYPLYILSNEHLVFLLPAGITNTSIALTAKKHKLQISQHIIHVFGCLLSNQAPHPYSPRGDPLLFLPLPFQAQQLWPNTVYNDSWD